MGSYDQSGEDALLLNCRKACGVCQAPTVSPTQAPTEAPTEPPTKPPTEAPTEAPTAPTTETNTETTTALATTVPGMLAARDYSVGGDTVTTSDAPNSLEDFHDVSG